MVFSNSDTEELLQRAEDGDSAAKQLLLTRHHDRLRRMIVVRMDPRLAARIDPSDVVQETAIEAARKLSGYLQRRDCAFYPWLRKIAWERLVQLHRQHIHAQKRSVKREVGWNTNLSNESVMLLAHQLKASGASPSKNMMRNEMQQRVRAALDRLTPQDREVVVLQHLEQLAFNDVAEVLSISESAVQSRYRRAIEQLHNLLSGGSTEELQ
ncbi:MAG: sigma-70 family RNA polymerase sigma factor [Planctomycetes bacterium]|nr:sigma-70 family RNA polymerase sigma factor [Planctomycetota bacterium]